MNKLLKFASVLLLPIFMLAFTVSQNNDAAKIREAISSGDAVAVAKYFDSSVDVTVMETSDTYSKSQAEQVLKSFFAKNKVTKFTKNHEMTSNDGNSESFVGTLTAAGKNYRVYVLLSNNSSSKIIQEISIKDN